MKHFPICLICTTIFLIACSELIHAAESCRMPNYPDQVSFVPEPSPETCEGQWVEMAVTNGECPANLTNCGKAVRGAKNTCISGRYKIEEHWSADGPNCTYFWLGPCAEDQVQATIDWTCVNNISDYTESCGFDPPEGFTQCENGAPKYHKWDGNYSVMETGSRPNHLKVWKWECD